MWVKATDEARSDWQRIQRREAQFELTMAHGRADLIAETPLTVFGWNPQIDSTDWLINEISHDLCDSAPTCSVELEVRRDGGNS